MERDSEIDRVRNIDRWPSWPFLMVFSREDRSRYGFLVAGVGATVFMSSMFCSRVEPSLNDRRNYIGFRDLLKDWGVNWNWRTSAR